eukprot:1925030-Pyramimonas_sp.AAC.1
MTQPAPMLPLEQDQKNLVFGAGSGEPSLAWSPGGQEGARELGSSEARIKSQLASDRRPTKLLRQPGTRDHVITAFAGMGFWLGAWGSGGRRGHHRRQR